MKRLAIGLCALLLLTSSLLAQTVPPGSPPVARPQPPERERGFKPGLLYEFNGFDSVNLFNGNLNLTIPIASYPVSADVAYSLVLRYSGNPWRSWEHCPHTEQEDPPCQLTWLKQEDDNAGMGWAILFGELATGGPTRQATAPPIPSTVYRGPDGGERYFYDTLHDSQCSPTVTTNCDHATPGVLYTRDGTYMRLRTVGTARLVEFPDGRRQRFGDVDAENNPVMYMYGASSNLDSSGIPTTNYVRFVYEPSVWKISDSHGRAHEVSFVDGRVDRIKVAAFGGGPPADYNLTYNDYSSGGGEPVDGPPLVIYKPCGTDFSATALTHFLRRIDLPSGETWEFQSHRPTAGCDDASGVLTQATLPTLGRIRWTYQHYQFSTTDGLTSVTGVQERCMRTDDGLCSVSDTSENQVQYARYTPVSIPASTVIETYAKRPSGWRVDFKTVNYYHAGWGAQFALPYAPGMDDGTGRKASVETFRCDSNGVCAPTPERTRFLRYEMDGIADPCHLDLPCMRDRNRRVVSERTLYADDGDRYADTNYSSFDGLGHYRLTATAGNFDSGNVRQSYTGFDATTTTYALQGGNGDPGTATRAPSFIMLPATARWSLNAFSSSYTFENGVTARTQTCFDPVNGFLKRGRVWSSSSASPTSRDLLTVYTRDAVSGYPAKEEFFGGDRQPLSTSSDLCNLPLPSHDSSSFSISHTFDFGALKTSKYNDASVQFFSVDNTIDGNTGFASQTRDAAGLVTGYLYDASRRLTQVSPPGASPTTYTYQKAVGSTPATAGASTASGDLLLQQAWEFDPFGRVSVEKRLIPDGTWSGRKTTYDHGGRRAAVSEEERITASPFLPVHWTRYESYDPFGRAGIVTAPDNKTITFTYAGESSTTRSYIVAKPAGDTTVSAREELDRAGRLVAVTEDLNGPQQQTTTYTYDVGNRLATVQMTDGQTVQLRTFDYDGRGLLTSEEHPESGTSSYEYDARGHVVQRTNAVGTLTYEYDRAERLRRVLENGQELKFFTYDRPNAGSDASLGKMASALRHNRSSVLGDVSVTETFTYAGPGGRISRRDTSLSTGESFFETYSYNATGDLSTLTYPQCAAGCPSLTAPSRAVLHEYRQGLLANIGAYTNEITYHPNGMLWTVPHTNANGTNGPVYTQTMANGMARPASISVSSFCEDANLQIAQQPRPRTVTSGSQAGLTVTAPGATTYRWYHVTGTTVIDTGDQDATLSVIVTQTGMYFVRVGNGACTIDSEKATVTVSTPVSTGKDDFNRDGRDDIIWRHGSTGANSYWFLNGNAVVGGGAAPGVSDSNWKLAGTGDFNADTHTDMLWHHDVTAQNTVWFMNGPHYVSQSALASLAVQWKPSGVGDFDGNGTNDIVWRNSVTGENSIWLLNGTTQAGGGPIASVTDLTWKLVGAGDINGDGRADLIWWSSSAGSLAGWLMNGLASTSVFIGQVADTSWKASAVADTNGDGRADVIWRNVTTGEASVWLLNGATVTGGGFIGAVADLQFDVAGAR